MSPQAQLTKEFRSDISRIGTMILLGWFKENDIKLESEAPNVYDVIDESLANGSLSMEQLEQGIAEIEENGDKDIRLYKAKNYTFLEKNKPDMLKALFKKGIKESKTNWRIGHPGESVGNFIYMFWEPGVLKIKFGEKQHKTVLDPDTEKVERVDVDVRVIIYIDTSNGLTQLRLDKPGNRHNHKNDEGKSSALGYENYYVDKMRDLFPDLTFSDFPLAPVANHIEANEIETFRLKKGTVTITDNAKQTYIAAGKTSDIRNIPEYQGALAKGNKAWRSEDLSGDWLASKSDGMLKKDLFMRISRRDSHVRIQRGCLEKELFYGIEKIREIQKAL
jgi:hypothetical protein